VAAILPYLLRISTLEAGASAPMAHKTLISLIIATAFGCWLLRNLTTYPGVERISYVLTAFAISYGIVLAILVVGRLPYNRPMLFSSFIFCIIWFYFVRLQATRSASFRVAVTERCNLSGVENIRNVTLVPFDNPSEPPAEIDAVATDLRIDMSDEWERKLADLALSGIPVYHVKHLSESLTGRVELEHLSENNFGSLSPISAYMTLKHLVDWLFALAVFLFFSPVLLVCGIIIRIESRGPALFKQERMGYQGRSVCVYKLRTMVHEIPRSDDRVAAMTKDGDARITRFGRLLRTTRIDELPQLINVLKGEMSWIGPRPEAMALDRWYEAEIPFYRYRHIVRPGITGWAQVNQGHVSHVDDVRRKLQFDFYYIKNFSPWLDLLIVAKTVRTMLTGFGAR
jgi:lipopolysaccharide/colanic/teichoic acid biosynthesis glycosyltransferase